LSQLNGVMEEAISGQKVLHAFRRKESAVEDVLMLVRDQSVTMRDPALPVAPITAIFIERSSWPIRIYIMPSEMWGQPACFRDILCWTRTVFRAETARLSLALYA